MYSGVKRISTKGIYVFGRIWIDGVTLLHRRTARIILPSVLSLLGALLLSGFTRADFDGRETHSEIIKEGLAGTICPENIEVIVNGSNGQDKKGNEAEYEPQRHFETRDLNRSYDYVRMEQQRVLNYARDADSNEVSRARALYHFGLMLHTVQDFYSNTNYLKLKIDALNRTEGGVGDPYSVELFDWSKLVPHKVTLIGGSELKLEANKETRRARQRLPLAESTYLKVERGLAIRETMRQWNYLEALIKNRYGERAVTILIALQQASCSIKMPPEPEDAAEAAKD